MATESGLANGRQTRPAFSQDGRFLVYSFDDEADFTVEGKPRDHDGDVCLGVLPATGGQRRASICHLRADSTFLRDGIEHGALAADGTLAFVMHSGVVSSGTSTSGALFLAPVDSLAGAREVFRLKLRPPGALGRWDDLLNPTWTDDHRLVALASAIELVVPAPRAPPDTIYTGLEVIRFTFESSGTTWQRLATAGGAEMLAWDGSANRGWVLRQNSVFDALTGEIIYTIRHQPDASAEAITGLATGGGGVFVSERVVRTMAGGTTQVDARIARVITLDSAATVLSSTTFGTDAVSWIRLAVSPDGRRFAFEQVGAGAWAIYTYDMVH
ncbi:MAG: hypothetical protein ABI542_04560 [Gemmatimonadota bacterium]